MFQYTAPNPYKKKQSGWAMFSSSLFGSSTSSISSSESIGELILPAQKREARIALKNQLNAIATAHGVEIEEGTVKTHDGATIESLEITPKEFKGKRFIIKFNGNGAQYQDSIDDFAHDAKVLNAKVIAFNYRGVGISAPKPRTYQELVTDGIAQVQRLLDQGVDSKSILLDGHSLGGSIATMVAKHFHNKKRPIYLWNDRSFASISQAAAGIISHVAIESVVAVSSHALLAPAGWDKNVAEAYLAIPEQYKGYMFVSKKAAGGLGDGVISNPASLHKGVKDTEAENHMSTGHKMLTVGGAGHNLPRMQLFKQIGNKNINGQEIYEEYVNSHLSAK